MYLRTSRVSRRSPFPTCSRGETDGRVPGYYEAGSFGIRTESALVVKRVKTKREFGEKEWYGFERFTKVRPCGPHLAILIETDFRARHTRLPN